MNKTTKIKKIVLEEYIKIISEQQDDNLNNTNKDKWYDVDYNSDPFGVWSSSPAAYKIKYKYISIVGANNKKYRKEVKDWIDIGNKESTNFNINDFLKNNQGYFSDQYGNSFNDLIDNLLKDKEFQDSLIANQKEKREKEQIAAGTKTADEWQDKKLLKITLNLLLSTAPHQGVSFGMGTNERLLTNSILQISSIDEFNKINSFLDKICKSIKSCTKGGDFWVKYTDNYIYLFLPKYKKGTTDLFQCYTQNQVEDLVKDATSWKDTRNVFKHGWLNLDYVSKENCNIISIINNELDYKGTSANDDKMYLELIREHFIKLFGNKAKSNEFGWLKIGSETLKLPQNTKYTSRRFTDI